MSVFRGRVPRLLVRSTAAAVAAGATTIGGLQIWSSQCRLEPIPERADPLLAHPWIKTINPHGHPAFSDCFVVDVPFSQIRSGLVQDAAEGGSRLLERLAAGVWGGYGFDVQRTVLRVAKKDESNAGDLWDRNALLQSKYPEGTIVADDFVVLEKSPSSIMLRGGSSPRNNPNGQREMDTVVVLSVEVDREKQTVRFRLRSLVVDGVNDSQGPPIDSVAVYLHQVYAKVLLKNGIDYCSV